VVEYEEAPPAPFFVYGWVNASDGAPVVNPGVTITNLNTSEVFIAETIPDSSFYQVLTSSWNVSAGDVLRFDVSNGGAAAELEHEVTEEEMDTGGLFNFNLSLTMPPEILSYAPETPVSDVVGDARTFNITVDQTVNVSWLINGTVVQTNESVTEASYTNTSAVAGYWNVSAVVTNENGTAMQTWWWTVIVKDITPPASITNLHNTTYAPTYINWSWTNPADADFNYTMVYINGTWEKNTSEPFYNATGLNPDTAYEIGTRTVDKVGNINMTWVNHSARTAPAVPLGVCGDVTGDKSIDIGDVILLGNHVRYPAKYPVDEWAADVNCDSSIDIGDVILLGNHVRYPAKYPLRCCEI